MAYTLRIKESAQRELDSLQSKQRRLIEGKISSLEHDPRPPKAKALKSDKFKGLYRIRAGNFRIIYQIDKNPPSVLVIRIGDRKDVYD